MAGILGATVEGSIGDWWHSWSEDDRTLAEELFKMMGSGAGFGNDLQQGRSDRRAYRRLSQPKVRYPSLVTAARDDAGAAFAHAEDFADTIPTATLVELDAPTCSGSGRHTRRSKSLSTLIAATA